MGMHTGLPVPLAVTAICLIPPLAWSEAQPDAEEDDRTFAVSREGEFTPNGALNVDAHHKVWDFQASLKLHIVLTHKGRHAGRWGFYLAPLGSVDWNRTISAAGTADSEDTTHAENLWSGSAGVRFIFGPWGSTSGKHLPNDDDAVAVTGVSVLADYRRAVGAPDTDQIWTPGETVVAWVKEKREGSLGWGLRLHPGDSARSRWYIPVSAYIHLGLLGQGKWSVPHIHRFVSEKIENGKSTLTALEDPQEPYSFLVSRPTFVVEFAWQWGRWTFMPALDARVARGRLTTITGTVVISYALADYLSFDINSSVTWEKVNPGEIHAYPQQDPTLKILWGPSVPFSFF